jgi:hypothetical protein
MADPLNAYDTADYAAHSLSPKQEYSRMVSSRQTGGAVAFFGVDFYCDTQARSFCTKNDDGSDKLVDYVLLQHNLRVMPAVSTVWRGWDRYRLFVRALDKDASASLHQGDAIPTDQLGNWFNNERATGVCIHIRFFTLHRVHDYIT